jgi:hypothetical protein
LALELARRDYLLHYPPIFLDEPYQLRACLSYCDTRLHKGTLYRAARFQLARKNDDRIETYWKPLDALDADADQAVRRRSAQDARAQHYRATRARFGPSPGRCLPRQRATLSHLVHLDHLDERHNGGADDGQHTEDRMRRDQPGSSNQCGQSALSCRSARAWTSRLANGKTRLW